MRKVVFALMLGFLMVNSTNCNIEGDFMNTVKRMMSSSPFPNKIVKDCRDLKNYFSHDFPINQLSSYETKPFRFTFFGKTYDINLFDVLGKLAFTQRNFDSTFDNYINASGISGVLVRVTWVSKWSGFASVRAGVAIYGCNMIQQYREEKYTARRLLCNNGPTEHTRTIPRGLEPQELETVQNFLQHRAAQELYNIGKAQTGLSASEDILENQHINEARKLRRWYREIVYKYSELINVPLNDLPKAVKMSSFNTITDAWVHNRIKQVAQSASKSSIFHAPNNDYMFVISIAKAGSNFNVVVSAFKFGGAMPSGAFAWSTGGWNIERSGRNTNPSTRDLVFTFPALK